MPLTTRCTARVASWVDVMEVPFARWRVRLPDSGAAMLRPQGRPVCRGWRATRSSRARRSGLPRAARREHSALRAHEREVRDAEEAEQEAQVRLAEFRAGTGRVHAAARDRHDDLLAARQSLRTLRGVAEGAVLDGDPIDPGLQLRGQAEVIKRCADDDDIRVQERLQRRPIPRGVPPSAPAREAAEIVGQRLGGQVLIGDAAARGVRPSGAPRFPASAARLDECSPRMLESRCSSFMTVSLCPWGGDKIIPWS